MNMGMGNAQQPMMNQSMGIQPGMQPGVGMWGTQQQPYGMNQQMGIRMGQPYGMQPTMYGNPGGHYQGSMNWTQMSK